MKNIDEFRQLVYADKFGKSFRHMKVYYIYGKAGIGKISLFRDTFGYENIYRTSNYKHPFDSYRCQDILVLEEFRSSIDFSDILNFLDGHPCLLPSRYFDKQACYTKVFVVSNIPFDEQYDYIKRDSEDYNALRRRFNGILRLNNDGSLYDEDNNRICYLNNNADLVDEEGNLFF